MKGEGESRNSEGKKKKKMESSQQNIVLNTYFHTIAFSDALYLAFPFMQISWTPDVFRGVGIRT